MSDEPITTQEEAFDRAMELENKCFELVREQLRSPIVLSLVVDDDGEIVSAGVGEMWSPHADAELDLANYAYCAFLDEHRALLGDHPHFAAFYDALDRGEMDDNYQLVDEPSTSLDETLEGPDPSNGLSF